MVKKCCHCLFSAQGLEYLSHSLLPMNLCIFRTRSGVRSMERGYSFGTSSSSRSNANIWAVRNALTIPMPWYAPHTHWCLRPGKERWPTKGFPSNVKATDPLQACVTSSVFVPKLNIWGVTARRCAWGTKSFSLSSAVARRPVLARPKMNDPSSR